jgi:F0F1-type ATP synthase membrane subunit b/b'
METLVIFLIILLAIAFTALGVTIYILIHREEKIKAKITKAESSLDSERANKKVLITEIKSRLTIIKSELEAIDKLLKG